MLTTEPQNAKKALLLVRDKKGAAQLAEKLNSKGLSVVTRNDPYEALVYCVEDPPELAVVEANLDVMAGIGFLAKLLRISWTTATVLISDEDEEVVHERSEGLGILGQITGYHDAEGLERLLERHHKISVSGQ